MKTLTSAKQREAKEAAARTGVKRAIIALVTLAMLAIAVAYLRPSSPKAATVNGQLDVSGLVRVVADEADNIIGADGAEAKGR